MKVFVILNTRHFLVAKMSGQFLYDLENGRAIFIPLNAWIECGFSMLSRNEILHKINQQIDCGFSTGFFVYVKALP